MKLQCTGNNVHVRELFQQIPSTPPSSDEWYSHEPSFMNYSQNTKSDDWFSSIASRVAVASLTSQGTIGGLLVSGFVSISYFVFRCKLL